MKKYIVRNYQSTRVDPETGELIEVLETKEVQKVESEPFFLTYSKQLVALYDSKYVNATMKVLYKMLEYMEFNTGEVFLPIVRVKEIMKVCNISRTSYHRAINELIEMGVITKGEGVYHISEDMFWRGDAKAREQVLKARMKISFTAVFPDEAATGESCREQDSE